MRYRIDFDRAWFIDAGSAEEARQEALAAIYESPDLLAVDEARDVAADLYEQERAEKP